VRQASREASANVAIMIDTKGVEIRTGEVDRGSVELVEGDPFTLWTDKRLGDATGVSVSHARLPAEVEQGSRVFLDDGHIELRVESTEKEAVRCTVVRGGELGTRKGVNVPGAALSLSAMGPADLEDLLFAVELGVDYVAASFVRGSADVLVIREILRSRGADVPVIAKIENREGVAKLEEIIQAADGTMVARGDLGVELPVEQVPLVQKKIIRATVGSGKPVITATQMLDSMERNARPTRAEASDVANAILDGTSAVMLSGETAKGRYPVEAVRTMASLALEAEASLNEYGDLQQIRTEPANVVTEAVAQAAITMARRLDAAAILTLTESGFTSRSISKYRPDCPILAVSSAPEVVRKLALNWGVTGLLYAGGGADDDKIRFAVGRAREICAEPGDVVVVTAGISRETGSTNVIRVVTV
jgi:pyruvate kinase